MGMTENKVRELFNVTTNIASINRPINFDNKAEPGKFIKDKSQQLPADLAMNSKLHSRVRELLLTMLMC